MVVVMIFDDGRKAYYRKLGAYCFDFVNSKKYATALTEDGAFGVLENPRYYLRMYGALDMYSEPIEMQDVEDKK